MWLFHTSLHKLLVSLRSRTGLLSKGLVRAEPLRAAMTAEPIRSALGTVSKEDTSLVLPSDGKHRTGQQRVLEQVKSIKRGKSKMVKSDSIPSPTTPASATEFSEPKFQFSPAKLNDTLFKFSGSSMMTTQSRVTGRSMSVRNTVRRQAQNSQSDSQMNWKMQSQSNGMKASASKLENSTLISASQSQFKTFSSQSQSVKKFTRSKSETSGANGAMGAMPDITLKEAVEFLTHSDLSYQLCGASFIQHQTFTEDTAKQEVWRLGGVPALVQLLKSENIQLQQTAAAALRNMVFKENEIKLEVESCDGLEAILTLLRNTDVTETQKQLTGLLWNLSSADALKPELIRNALPLLTESIVVPFNFWTDSNINKHIDAEVFHNTTGCLRNLSCASDKERTSMRNCTQLIDSLMTYVQTQVERGEPDDKTVENCVCILHNLSYQLEKEAPEHFTEFSIPDGSSHENMNKNSLFSPRSSKAQKEFRFPAMEEGQPEGVKCLFHRKSLQLYLSLLGSSHKEATLEACCGALQNLTASKSPVSTVMTQSIIQKLQGLSVISPLLYSANPGLQKTAMSLVGNMSRVSSLRSTMAKEVLPTVSSVLSVVTPNMIKSDSSIATACRVMHTLMLADPECGKKVLNSKLIDSLSMLSTNMSFETARKAAAVLLWSMWGQKDIQNGLKKQGMNKDTFINAVTATAYQAATSTKGQ